MDEDQRLLSPSTQRREDMEQNKLYMRRVGNSSTESSSSSTLSTKPEQGRWIWFQNTLLEIYANGVCSELSDDTAELGERV